MNTNHTKLLPRKILEAAYLPLLRVSRRKKKTSGYQKNVRGVRFLLRFNKYLFSAQCGQVYLLLVFALIFYNFLSLFRSSLHCLLCLLQYNVVSLCRGFVTAELACICLGGRIDTDTGCAGRRRVERTNNTQTHYSSTNPKIDII